MTSIFSKEYVDMYDPQRMPQYETEYDGDSTSKRGAQIPRRMQNRFVVASRSCPPAIVTIADRIEEINVGPDKEALEHCQCAIELLSAATDKYNDSAPLLPLLIFEDELAVGCFFHRAVAIAAIYEELRLRRDRVEIDRRRHDHSIALIELLVDRIEIVVIYADIVIIP